MIMRNSASICQRKRISSCFFHSLYQEFLQSLYYLYIPYSPYIASYSHRDGRMKSTGTWSASPLLLPFMQVFKAAVSLIPNKTSAKSSTKPIRDAKNTYKQQLAFVCSHHLTFKFSVPKRIFISTRWRQCDKLVTHFTYNHFY